MSDDGADMGVLLNRALKTILGGGEQPTKEERLTPEAMREEIMAQPDKYEGVVGFDGRGYDNTILWLAKQFLILLDEGLVGDESYLYAEMIKRNGEKDYGLTGLMVGYANNAARYCVGKLPQANPAVMLIKTRED